MFGKLTALIIAGFAAALVSTQDFRVSEQLNSKMDILIPKTSERAFPAGFLSDSQLVKDSDRQQWIYDQLPSAV